MDDHDTQDAAAPSQGSPRTGWYRSSSGTVMHADGPDMRRALADQGWTEIDEDQAKQSIASGIQLVVDRSDSGGTFDADAVRAAVRDEAPTPRRRREPQG
jgi:hypothetical protein